MCLPGSVGGIRAIVKERVPTEMQDAQQQYAVFRMGGEEFALEINRVVEVLPRQGVLPIPNLPEFFAGIIDLRGLVVPVLDLRKRFRLDPEPGSMERVIIIRKKKERIGVLVDEVMEVLSFDSSTLSAPPSIFAGIGSEYLKGIGKTDGRMIMVLEIRHILSNEELRTMKRTIESGKA